MAVDTTPGSPGWWLQRLGEKLERRRPRYDLLERYWIGDHPLPEGDERCRDMFRRFQRKARTNYCGLAAESVRERLHVTGFRTGAAGDEVGDREANRIWQANHLDADSGLVHLWALVFGDAYVCVGEHPEMEGMPLITPEDPREVIAEYDPRMRRRVRAALKTYVDDVQGVRHGVLYLPDMVHYFAAKTDDSRFGREAFNPSAWTEVEDPAVNPWGRVPVVRFVNRPGLRAEGLGEFEDAIDVQDRINNVVLDRLVISKVAAYRQRWAKNIATEDDDGNPLDLPFVPGVDLLWAVDAPEAGEPEAVFGEFEQTDMSGVLDAAREDIKAFVVLTGLPPHYVSGDLTNAAADALAAAEARLANKSGERARGYSESWEQVMVLAFLISGDEERAQVVDMETLWAEFERKTEAQQSDAAVKKGQAGVTWRQRMVDLGYSPQEIRRMETQRAQDALNAALMTPAMQSRSNGQQVNGERTATAGTAATSTA